MIILIEINNKMGDMKLIAAVAAIIDEIMKMKRIKSKKRRR